MNKLPFLLTLANVLGASVKPEASPERERPRKTGPYEEAVRAVRGMDGFFSLLLRPDSRRLAAFREARKRGWVTLAGADPVRVDLTPKGIALRESGR